MLTQKTSVDGKIEIWAAPKPQWEIKAADYDGQPFKYVIGKPWTEGSVLVKTYEVSYEVPAGIDLLAAAVATLQQREKDILAEAHKAANDIRAQIQKLLMLGYEAPAKEVEGELIPYQSDKDGSWGEMAAMSKEHGKEQILGDEDLFDSFDDDIPF